MREKPILCIDFDGVIHTYDQGWQGGRIYGDVVDGFFEWAERAVTRFQLFIYSSRCKDEALRAAMRNWLTRRLAEWVDATGRDRSAPPPIVFTFAHEKPAAFLTIDDRAVRFDGRWEAPELDPETLADFRPWNVRAKIDADEVANV